jgi:hypothetical protein
VFEFLNKIFANFTFHKHRLFLKILLPATPLCPSLILKSFEPAKALTQKYVNKKFDLEGFR